MRKKIMRVAVWPITIGTLFAAPLPFVSAARAPSQDMALKSHSVSKRTHAFVAAKAQKVNITPSPSSTPIPSSDCSSGLAMHSGLQSAVSPVLKKLSQYEQMCSSAIASTASFFVPTPSTTQQAAADASDVITQLKEFAHFGIKPLVYFEPNTDTDSLMDLSSYKSGVYDGALDAYFAAIKAGGVTDAMMGTWVPLPEANIPVWTSVNPADFSGCVTKAATLQKKYFPSSKVSIMLDNLTYPSASSWDNGRAISLVPYLQGIPAGLVDSFGLQGFPWSPTKSDGGPTVDNASDYLRADLAVEAARTLNVNEIWMNTGTFGAKYTNQPTQQVTLSPNQRMSQLNGVVSVAKSIKSQGFKTSVHLFAENKSNVDEATDWSYWPSGDLTPSPSIDAFKSFVHNLQTNGIPLWLFDSI